MGTLEVPDRFVRPGTFDVAVTAKIFPVGWTLERATLTVAELQLEDGRRILAIKSDERPLEWWKLLRGFEATQ